MRIAIIGSGIFGCTIAIHLARKGHQVQIYDKKARCIRGATAHNQGRLHVGYHYPRSPETIKECKNSVSSFVKEYPYSTLQGGLNLYAIAKGSQTAPAMYSRAMADGALVVAKYHGTLLSREHLEAIYVVEERRIDLEALRMEVNLKMHREGLTPVCAGHDIHVDEAQYDQIIVAAYSGTNKVLESLGCPVQTYQYEVVEKPVVTMPKSWNKVSAVIMDGPFGCIDPFGGKTTKFHALGHVEHGVVRRNVGVHPEIPDGFKSLINSGILTQTNTSFDKFIEDGVKYIPALADAKHYGSMFTVRATLANVDDTDARPTMVDRVSDKVIRVFSGKIGTAVLAARKVCRLVEEM